MASYLSSLVSSIVPLGRSALADFGYTVGDVVVPAADIPSLWALHDGVKKVGAQSCRAWQRALCRLVC